MIAPLAQVVLAVLAFYHVATGLLAFVAPGRARRAMRMLYAADIEGSAAMDYVTTMVGAQALAIGALAAVAARAPGNHRAIVASLLLLQLLRAVARVVRHGTLRDSLHVPASRNALAVGVLLLECAALGGVLVTGG